MSERAVMVSGVCFRFFETLGQSSSFWSVDFSGENGVMDFPVALGSIFKPTASNTHGRIAARYSGPPVSKDVRCDHTAVLISSENIVAMVRVCNRIVIPRSKNFSD